MIRFRDSVSGHRRAVPTVVVTGVSGSLGSKVAALLAARPDVDRVVGLDVVPLDLADPKIEMRMVDLSAYPADPEIRRAMEGAGSVIHLAWDVSDGRRGPLLDDPALAAANLRALSGVLEAAGRAGVASLVHVSSATVYGAWEDNKIPLTEDDRVRPNPEFRFAVSKGESERALAEWADDHPSVQVAVLRPTVTVGTPGRPLYKALGITRSPRSGDGRRPVQYLHIDDLAGAVLIALEKKLTGIYNVAPDSGIPEEEARALVGGVARVALPGRLAAAVSAIGWRLWRAGVPAEARAYARHPWVVSPDRLKKEGWEPGHSSAEALVATDGRPHWDDLPPGRRQNYNLLVILAGLGAGAAGVGLLVAALLHRRSGGAR